VLFGSDTGLLAGGLTAVYPGAVGMSILVLAEALFCPLILVQLVSWVCAWRATSRGVEIVWAVTAGVAAGFAVLTRPSWLLFTPFVLGCLVLASPDRRRHLVIGLWMAGAFCAAMSPWWIRNYQVAGEFIPTTLQVGASLYDGLNPEATGASNMPFATPTYHAQKRDDSAAGRSRDGFEIRLDRRLRDAALLWARQHPAEVAQLAGRKFVRMWNIWPNASDFRSWPVKLVVAAGYVPVLVLGLIGAWTWGRRGWPYAVCLFPAVYLTCLHLVFVSSIRYREPAMLAWIVLAAAVVEGWWSGRVRRRAAVAGGAG
jgi:4-amino-4-deoxy-L-arabinose transferase-like glycosyltransferase